jgi:hypothetical protein
VTEDEWLACVDPLPLVDFLRRRASPRKLRLIACACCRLIWDRLTDERSRQGVEVAERFADGLATAAELGTACDAAYDASMAAALISATAWAAASAAASTSHPDIAARIGGDGGAVGMSAYRARGARRLRQCQVVRDVMGPLLFRRVEIAPAWLAWAGGTVPNLARAIHEERAFERLPVLADALEEAGCTDDLILDHCRSGGEHVGGCWLVDLALGRT